MSDGLLRAGSLVSSRALGRAPRIRSAIAGCSASACGNARACGRPHGPPSPHYAEKLEPQPQLLVAFGLLKTKPRPMSSSLKSIEVPLR